MADDFSPLNLRARLDALQERIGQAKSSLESHGIIGDQLAVLTKLAHKQSVIRGSLDGGGTVTELQHSKASVQTDELEHALDAWLKGVESRFEHPGERKPNVSM